MLKDLTVKFGEKRCFLSTLLFNVVFDVLASTTIQGKETKYHTCCKGRH